MINSIDLTVKNMIQMGLNFISPESVKNIARFGKKYNRGGKKKVPA